MKSKSIIKTYLKKFFRKKVKEIKIFGKKWTIFYLLPALHNNFIIRKLNKKYLYNFTDVRELKTLIKIDDEKVIKQLGKPIKRDANGIVLNVESVNGTSINNDMQLYKEKIDYENFIVKRYESLKVICEDMRKSGKSTNAFAIDVSSLPSHHSGM
jgi:hypothetical protein